MSKPRRRITTRKPTTTDDINIEYAARPWKPAIGGQDFGGSPVLYNPSPRKPVPQPAADYTRVNGRPAEDWEVPYIASARRRERELGRELLAGLT